MRHLDTVQGGPVAWLTATSHTTCVDIIRRSVRDPQGLDGLIGCRRADLRAAHGRSETGPAQLDAALRTLDDSSRQLIAERFFARTPLRVIAGREGKSVATLSRRVSGVLHELKAAMGMDDLEDAHETAEQSCCHESLRFASDWQSIGLPRNLARGGVAASTLRPGWNRPIRVGALVSHIGGITPSGGFYFPPEKQLLWAKFLGDPGFDLVGIVEPGTDTIGHIEQGLREFELTAGLIDGTDKAALATLDVIVLPPLFARHQKVLEAVRDVVAEGVGLYNQWWKGTDTQRELDPVIMQLMLSCSAIGTYHTPEGHGWPIPATVREEHPVIAGLSKGTPLLIPGCGPLYRPVKGARMLIAKDKLAESPGTPELLPCRMPVLLTGNIGRGRAIVDHKGFIPQTALGARFTSNVLEWLAAPRRESVQAPITHQQMHRCAS
jgi:hypothetical protein